jgi:hypothetical protein
MASERRRIFVKEVSQVAPRRQRPINLPGGHDIIGYHDRGHPVVDCAASGAHDVVV